MALNFLKKVPTIDFVRLRHAAYIISLVFLLIAVGNIYWNGGLHYGVDFAGGVMVQVQFEQPTPDQTVKDALNSLNIPGLSVQQFGEGNLDYLIRFTYSEEHSENLREPILNALTTLIPDSQPSIQRLEMVGPKVGEDLRNSALEAVFYAVLLITVYISGRFEKRWLLAAGIAATLGAIVYLSSWFGISRVWQVSIAMMLTLAVCYKMRLNFAFGAIIALLHDVLITLGFLTLLGREIDLNIIAALLTLVGYSLNDTIIIYDRIRENLYEQKPPHFDPLGTIVNLSINQTLSRTILTGGTTLLATLSLFLLGGGVIHDFALTMLIGVIIGTFSSIFVASPLLLALGDTELYHSRQMSNTEYERPGEHGIV